MPNIVINVGRGRVAELATRVNANDPTNSAFILVALKAAGLESDDALKDHDTLASILAAANDEATNTGYARIVLDQSDGITVNIDDTNDRVWVDFPDQTWSSVQTAGGAWGAVLVCYDPDTTGGTDTTIIPLTKHDFAVTPDGRDIDAEVDMAGFFRD
jgi:hypothetical protein